MNIPLTPVRFLRYAEQQYARRTAVVCGRERFTYSQLAERVSRLAGGLRKVGVMPGDRVAFLSLNCHRLLEAYFGVLEAGAVLLPLNIRLAPDELAYILNHAEVKTLFLEKELSDLADSFRPKLSTVESFTLLSGEPQASWLMPQNYEDLLAAATPYRPDIMEFDEDAVAEIFYTSGTSADPKGVMLTHRNIYLQALSSSLTHESTAESVHLHTIPLFHANGWGAAHTVTLRGAEHVMISRFDPAEIFRLIEQERVQSLSAVPAMAIALVNFPGFQKYDLSSLKWLNLGGAASSPSLVEEVEEKFGCTCYAGYGLTETAPTLSTSKMKPGLGWQGKQRFAGQAMAGFAIPGVELRVVDADDQDVARDGTATGEVIARGDNIMKGYWKQPEATAEAMRGGWFHTGDLATWNEEGYILIVDRKKDIIVSGGENISSLEVEKKLLAHPAVLEAAVIPVPDEKWGEVPKALVVLKPGAQANELELIEFSRSRLAHYKCPHSVEFLDSLPKTGTGKILKRDLRKKYWQGQETIRPEVVEMKRKGSRA
ncbi:MAG TPA: long-chain-fatty-acid--CoA ligase [Candidatus Acidoferrales bacterium]|nr:long-chain-fatty-acid--CoA ligase [Candidatus Acidoferrales bacterium]